MYYNVYLFVFIAFKNMIIYNIQLTRDIHLNYNGLYFSYNVV